MFEIEIAGMRLLYTGDYSRVPDRHLSAADTPDNPPDIGEQCSLLFWLCASNGPSLLRQLRACVNPHGLYLTCLTGAAHL